MKDEARNRGWWGRNWKWVVPVGAFVTLLLFAVAVATFFMLIFGQIRSSEVYVEALRAARSDADVAGALGEPIEDGLLVSGSFYSSGTSGYAEIAIPISGPDGSATIYGVAEKSLGDWTFTDLIVEIGESGRRINLLDGTGTEKTDQVRT